MATDTSAIVREGTPHEKKSTRTNTIVDALKRKAHAVLNDRSIDPRSRAVIRYALETNDPWLARLVRRADGDEEEMPETSEGDSSQEKIEALAEIICGGGDEQAGALFVLMGAIQNSSDPKVLANTAKHFAFTRCGELNLYGMVDAQIALVEAELLAGNTDMY